MEKESKFFEKFKDKDRTSLERPSPRAWDKLSQKLDEAQASEPKVVSLKSNYRWLGIAAGLIILVGAIGIINRGMQDTFANEKVAMVHDGPLEVEDLGYTKPSGFYALAIHTSQYYNVSPSKLADNKDANGSYKTRLQLRNRTTRQARQPEYLASNESFDLTKEPSSMKGNANADLVSGFLDKNTTAGLGAKGVDVSLDGVVDYYTDSIALTSVDASNESSSDYRGEQLADATSAYQKSKVLKNDKAQAEVEEKSLESVAYSDDEYNNAKKESESADYSQLDAASNVIVLSSKDLSELELDQFNWLVGNWTANYEKDKVNQQKWIQKDAYTLEGNATLTINGESLNVEKMEIKKVGDSFYFIRVNTQDGSTIKYRLKSLESNTVVFENTELKDQIIIQQNSENNFNNFLVPNRSMQINQFPGANQNNVEFSRNKNR